MNRAVAFGKVLVAVACAMSFAAQPVSARMRVHDMAESNYYKEKTLGMVGRGLLNGITFFVDTIVNTVNETREGPPLVGTLAGLGQGLGCSALRLGSGAVDIVTFWVPTFNGFPVSDSYSNCLDVETSSAAAPTYRAPAQDQPLTLETAPAYQVPAETPSSVSSAPIEPAGDRKWSK
jgi:putative exosortase-associated protein (TIGR04073 family)